MNFNKYSISALLNATSGLLSLFVAFFWIGLEAQSNREVFINLARNNPAPIIIQDLLKFATLATLFPIIGFFKKSLESSKAKALSIANTAAIISIACLALNASLSLFATLSLYFHLDVITNVGNLINLLITILGLLTIFINGFWYYLVNRELKRQKLFPAWLCLLGMTIGVISFIPLFAIVTLVLSIIWMTGVGFVLFNNYDMQPKIGILAS